VEIKSKFVLIKHDAIKAGLHYDLRFQIPGKKSFDSFAISKGIPLESGNKVIAIRTTIHTEKEAFFTGEIQKGFYGGGTLTEWDSGNVNVIKYKPNHIILDFINGKKVKGIYHMIHFSKMPDKMFILFKSKQQDNK
jgi:bifunctional non-homologous end joining protein LigD